MYKIDFNYRYGKDYVFCSEYKVDNYFVYPLNKEGNPMCTISRTNIISITKDNKTTWKKVTAWKDRYYQISEKTIKNSSKFTFKANTIMGKVSKETRREQRYNANLHNLFVKAQEEIANE